MLNFSKIFIDFFIIRVFREAYPAEVRNLEIRAAASGP
jgi:hypothetical protein